MTERDGTDREGFDGPRRAAVQDGGADAVAPFTLFEPEFLSSGVVFSSPHSGRAYFDAFVSRSALDAHRLRASEDAYVDALFDSAADCGAPLIAAVAPRAYVDLNRAPTDLDPRLIDGVRAHSANARVVAGLGVVPRIVAEGVPIYHGKISRREALARIAAWHAPYHTQLDALLKRAKAAFGRALLIDCHSMPTPVSALFRTRRGGQKAPIVLGDRFGAAACHELVDEIEAVFVAAGFSVARNAPFAGGYITERYGQPEDGVSAVQIEIDRGLYLDQKAVRPSAEFDRLRETLAAVVSRLCDLIRIDAASTSLAAE